jgi:predicted HicB family RNase H-like nuclease
MKTKRCPKYQRINDVTGGERSFEYSSVLIRIPPKLHDSLRASAKKKNMSLNALATLILTKDLKSAA